ncbi:MAG: outer membrane beta-barrel family protein [Pricia sp.]
MRKWSLILLVVNFYVVSAQTGHDLSAIIIDDKKELVSVGDALLMQNNNLVEYATISEGRFLMESVPEGSYRLRISCLGFKTLEQEVELVRNISLSIQLNEDTTNLDGIEVSAAKPILTNNNGNLKIDISNPVFSSIPDPMDLLSKFPGIQVSPNRESLSILGKGIPLIYLGNQRITLEEFSALSVDDIDSIEIIKNPSSKYEAEGRAVLLVTRKISETEGVKLNLSETLSFRQNFNNYNSLNGSYNRQKLILKANFAFNDLRTWESQTFAFEIPEQDIFSDYLFLIDKNDRTQINTGGGLLYQIDETDYFSFNTNAKMQSNAFPINTETLLRQEVQEDLIVSESQNDNTRNFVSSNFNYNTQLNLFAGLQYSTYVQKMNSDILNNTNDAGFVRAQMQKQKYGIGVLAFRLDLEKNFDNDLKVEVGANISDARADASASIQFFETGRREEVDYNYSENTFASYASVSGNISKKTDFSAGLRIENNQVRGETDLDSDVSQVLNVSSMPNSSSESDAIPLIFRENTRFFPKAVLDFEIDSTKNLTLNYSKSIERPDYSRATSIRVFINPFLEGSGNVNLLPTLTEEVSVNFQSKQKSIAVNYLRRKNPMYFTIGYEEGAENAVFALRNLEVESGLDISLTLPITKGLWTASNFLMLSYRKIEDSTAVVNASKPYLYASTEHQFDIGKDTTLSVGGWAITKSSEGIFQRNGLASFNASITKTFFEKLHCSLRFNDITKAQNFEEAYSINGVIAEGIYFADAREVAFSIKYSLGTVKDPDYKNKDTDENLDRIQ